MAPASLSLILVTSEVLGLGGPDAVSFVARALVFVAVFTVLQVAVGHRLPAFEGPASVTLAALVVGLANSRVEDPVAAMGGALVASGVVVALFGMSGALGFIARVYTPWVMGVFFILLAATVVWALGPEAVRDPSGGAGVYPAVLVLVVAVTLGLEMLGRGIWRTLSFLIAFVVGATVFLVMGELLPAPGGGALTITSVTPAFDAGVVIPVATAALLVAVNSLATVGAVSASAGRATGPGDLRRGSVVTGLSHAVQGLVPGVGSVPRADSAALAALAPGLARPSLVAGCLGLTVLAAVPPAVQFLVRLPPALAADVLFAVFASLLVLAWRSFRETRWSRGRWVAFAVALGVGAALVPGPPPWLPDPVEHLANPIFIGVAIALIAEGILARDAGTAATLREP